MRPESISSMRGPLSSSIIVLTIISILNLSSIKCDDHSQEPDQSTGANQQQLADPEYIKRELKDVIWRKIDADKDGSVSFGELKSYLVELHDKNTEYNVEKQWIVYQPQIHEVFSWEGYEPERKEVLTWDHYFNQTYPELIGVDIGVPIIREQDTASVLNPPKEEKKTEKAKEAQDEEEDDPHMKMLKLMVHRADARWKLADENGDTLLTKQEFKNLLHPDEGNEELQNLFVREATEDMDLNKNGQICLEEFTKHLKVLANDQERDDKNWMATQQENFGRFLDKNKDGVLDSAEIREWLIPSKAKRAETEAKRLMDIGDSNDDHKLSNAELLENYEQYLSLLPAEYWRNSNDLEEVSEASMMGDQGSHDEL